MDTRKLQNITIGVTIVGVVAAVVIAVAAVLAFVLVGAPSQTLALPFARDSADASFMLATNARDEPHFAEWVAHHLNLGFHHVHVFDHVSIIPIADTLNDDTRVHVTRIDEPRIIKMSLMSRALQQARRTGATWLLYLDADEYLVLPPGPSGASSIAQWLQRQPEAARSADAITFNWLMFGSNYLDVDNVAALTVAQYTRAAQTFDPEIKMLVRVTAGAAAPTTEVSNPHVFPLPPNARLWNATTRSVRVFNADGEPWFNPAATRVRSLTSDAAFIAHYYNQAYDTFVARKQARPRDDTNEFRDVADRATVHAQHNDVPYTRVAELYAAAIAATLPSVRAARVM